MYNPIIYVKRNYDVSKEAIRKIWILHGQYPKYIPVESGIERV